MQALRPVDLDMSIELLKNLTESRVYVNVPESMGGGDYGSFVVSEEGGDKVSDNNALLEDTPGSYHISLYFNEAAVLRTIAARSEHKKEDDNNREWSRVNMTLEAKYTMPNGSVTTDYHVSSAPMWVETSCRFAENGPLGQLTVPTQAEVSSKQLTNTVFSCLAYRT
ncbi:MAG: hypothetical protein MHM6MM_007656 [Cercozoa sp. M6MM]